MSGSVGEPRDDWPWGRQRSVCCTKIKPLLQDLKVHSYETRSNSEIVHRTNSLVPYDSTVSTALAAVCMPPPGQSSHCDLSDAT